MCAVPSLLAEGGVCRSSCHAGTQQAPHTPDSVSSPSADACCCSFLLASVQMLPSQQLMLQHVMAAPQASTTCPPAAAARLIGRPGRAGSREVWQQGAGSASVWHASCGCHCLGIT